MEFQNSKINFLLIFGIFICNFDVFFEKLKVSVYVTRVHKHFLKQPPSKSTVSGGPSNIEKFWNAEIPEMVL